MPIPKPTVYFDDISYKTDPKPLKWPTTGIGAVGTLKNGVLAVQDNEEKPRPIASINKVITALVLLEKHPISTTTSSPNIVINEKDIELYNTHLNQGGSVTKVELGQNISQYEALEIMLIASANNIADTLAIWGFGSNENFLVAANKYVKTNGLNNTIVNDASGFSPETKSTPSDLIRLGQLALNNPVVAGIVKKPKATLSSVGELSNTNWLLTDLSAVGIKTGTTVEAGACLLFALNIDDNDTLIGVVMGASTKDEVFAYSKELLNTSKLNFQNVELITKGKVIGRAATNWGNQVDVKAKDSLNANVWGGNQPKVTFSKTSEPNSSAQTIGQAKYGENSIDLVLGSEIPKPSIWWRLANPKN